VVSFNPRPISPQGKRSRYPLDRRLCGPQSRSGLYGEQKNLAPSGNRTPAVQIIDRRYADRVIPAPAFWDTVVSSHFSFMCSLTLKFVQ
jgi:hypothetical protein